MRRLLNRTWRRSVRRNQVETLERRLLLYAGQLDLAFGGGDGIVTTDFGGAEKALDVAVLPGGAILIAGTRGVMRYAADGTLDKTFGGGDGRADLTVDATALAVQGNGGILAVRSGEIVRFTPDGTRDMAPAAATASPRRPPASARWRTWACRRRAHRRRARRVHRSRRLRSRRPARRLLRPRRR